MMPDILVKALESSSNVGGPTKHKTTYEVDNSHALRVEDELRKLNLGAVSVNLSEVSSNNEQDEAEDLDDEKSPKKGYASAFGTSRVDTIQLKSLDDVDRLQSRASTDAAEEKTLLNFG